MYDDLCYCCVLFFLLCQSRAGINGYFGIIDYMQALDEAVIGENDDCINYVIDYLSYTSEKMNKWDDKLYILPNRRRAYENILSKIEGRKDVSDIKFTIKNAEERYEKWSLSNAEADL